MEESNLTVYSGNELRSTSLRDFLAVVFRYRRLAVSSFSSILFASVLFALLQSNHYVAEMKILVKPERADPALAAGSASAAQPAAEVTEEQINSELELLKSRDLLEKVVLACGLVRGDSAWYRVFSSKSSHPGARALEKSAQLARAVRALEKDLKLDVVKKTDLIAVSYESTNPQLAARVLTTVASFYLEKHLAVRRPPGAFDFFQRQTNESRKELADAEARLVAFTQGGSAVSAQAEKEAALQKLAEFDGTLKETQAAIADTQQRIGVLEQQSVSTKPRMVTQVRNTDDALLLSQLRANLLTLELKRTELLDKFAPTYRPVQEVEAQLAQTRTALAAAEKSPLHEETTDGDPTYEWVKEELAKARASLAGLQARAVATELAVESYRQKARSLERQEIAQDDLIRTVQAREESYQLYVRKEEEARISDALDRNRIINVAVAEPAIVPSLPSNRRGVTVLVGFVFAVLISLGLAFASEHLDTTFRTPDEVTLFLNIPVLAAMPREGKNGQDRVNQEGVTPDVP